MTARGGFTLVEVLVVMAIMVVLFGMLFVPLSSSIDMARAGQSRVQMQQHLQMAMQRVNRGISGAQSISLPEYIPIANNPGAADDTYLINYSNITFQPPGYIQPPGEDQPVVRYAVMTQEYSFELIGGDYYCIPQPPDIDNPWILYRMEGMMRPIAGHNYFGAAGDANGDGVVNADDATRDINEDGSIDVDDIHIVGYWSSRNALTPDRNADIPVTRTICLDAVGYLVLPPSPPAEPGQLWAKGYVHNDDIATVFGATGVKLVYIHDGVTFGPLRVANERIAPTGNTHQTTFSDIEYRYWLGLQNDGTYTVSDAIWGPTPGPMLINSSELRPRIVVRREVDGSGYEVIMDTDDMPGTYNPNPAYYDGDSNNAVINNMYGTSWNSDTGEVSLNTISTSGGTIVADFNGGTYTLASPPAADYTWDFTASGYGTVNAVWDAVYGEEIVDTTLAAAVIAGSSSIEVNDVTGFSAGDDIRIVDADGTNYDDVTIASTDTVADPDEITFAPDVLSYSYEPGDLVRERGDVTKKYTRAYSTYQITPPIEPGLDPDKMIIPGSIDVKVYGIHSIDGERSRTYTGMLFPSPGSQDDITEGQFYYEPVAAGDYTSVNIYFGNGVSGRPPNPDNPATYGGEAGWTADILTAFWIEISYDVRRNFSTLPPYNNDQIDVSYSTRAIYNVSLELLPWRYYEDNDNDHIWTPYQHTKGVHLQGHIRIAALGG